MFIKTLRAAGAGLVAIVLVNGQLLRAESSSLTCDFSGQKWTLRKSSGGQNGWTHNSDANSEFMMLRVVRPGSASGAT